MPESERFAADLIERATETYWDTCCALARERGIPHANVKWRFMGEEIKSLERDAIAAALGVVAEVVIARRKADPDAKESR